MDVAQDYNIKQHRDPHRSIWPIGCTGRLRTEHFELRPEIVQFMEHKGKPVTELDKPDCLMDIADITEHLNVLNVNMQGRNKLVQYYDRFRAFKMKLAVGNTTILAPSSPLYLSITWACGYLQEHALQAHTRVFSTERLHFFTLRLPTKHQMCQRNFKWSWSNCSIVHRWQIEGFQTNRCYQCLTILNRQPLRQRSFV